MAAPSPTSSSHDKDTLSIPATVLYRLGLPLITGTLYLYSPATAIAVPFVAAPTVALLYNRSQKPLEKRPGDLESLIWTFIGAATLAPAVSAAVQAALGYGAGLLIFRKRMGGFITEMTRSADEVRSLSHDMVSTRESMAHSWSYLAYLTLFSFSLAGLPEEAMKYAILRYFEHRHNRSDRPKLTSREYMLYATTIGLGFSFLENTGFIYAAATTDTTNMLLVTAAERILYGTAAHVFTALLTGARMAKAARNTNGKRPSWLQIILPSMLYHGAGDAALLGACAVDGHPGFVHPETVGRFAKYLVAPLALITGLGLEIDMEVKDLGVGWFGIW